LAEFSFLFPYNACYRGIYIHVPFCVRKCAYCSFYSLVKSDKWFDRYVNAVLKQMRQAAAAEQLTNFQARSLFFGGGTPTVLPIGLLEKMLTECCSLFDVVVSDAEITMEMNPATVDARDFERLRAAGINRLSLGVQSFDDTELTAIGRVHTAADAVQAFTRARETGFDNLSLDLMYGLPGQDPPGWLQTLEQALALEPDHVSVYELTLEPGTPLADRVSRGEILLPDEEDLLAMHEHTLTMLAGQGFRRYEISNYARPGKECRHNINYWQNGSWLGFGPSAVSSVDNRRTTTVADVAKFCRNLEGGCSAIDGTEQLDTETRFRETVIMGLRMLDGLCLQELEQRFTVNPIDYYGPTLKHLIAQNLLEIRRNRLRLTGQGLLLANSVMAELV
jgi:oxygen-independent coproporphyrinogen-3 oxidase